MTDSAQDLRNAVKAFIERRKLSPTRVGRLLFGNPSFKADVSDDEIVRRGRVVGAAAARAWRHPARHDRHRGHPLDFEQAEQARVDRNPGFRAVETRAHRLHGRPQPLPRDPAQHQGRAHARGVPRPLPPALRRHGEAHEDDDFGRARPAVETLSDPRRLPFGRKRGGGPGFGGSVPRDLAGPFQGTIDDPPRPRTELAVAGLAHDFGGEVAGLRFRRGCRLPGRSGPGAERQQHDPGEPVSGESSATLSEALHNMQHVRFLHSR